MAWAPWAGHWLGTKEVSLGLGFFVCDIPAHLAFLGVKRRKEEKWRQEGEPSKDSPAESKHPGPSSTLGHPYSGLELLGPGMVGISCTNGEVYPEKLRRWPKVTKGSEEVKRAGTCLLSSHSNSERSFCKEGN